MPKAIKQPATQATTALRPYSTRSVSTHNRINDNTSFVTTKVEALPKVEPTDKDETNKSDLMSIPSKHDLSQNTTTHQNDEHDPIFIALKHKLALSPKTTHLLIKLGYTSYTDLRDVTPNLLLAQFRGLRMNPKLVEGYRRAVRRMVWLGTQDRPEDMAKTCGEWSIKGLRASGVWVDEWDELTGREVEDRFGKGLAQMVVWKEKVEE